MRNLTGDSDPVLCMPASKIDIFLELFHSSILGGHMGMSKCVLTLQQKFYCPHLAYHVRYISLVPMYVKHLKIIKDLTDL